MPRQQRSLVDGIPFLGERDLMTDARRETLRPPSRVGMRMLLVAALVALGSLTTTVPRIQPAASP